MYSRGVVHEKRLETNQPVITAMNIKEMRMIDSLVLVMKDNTSLQNLIQIDLSFWNSRSAEIAFSAPFLLICALEKGSKSSISQSNSFNYGQEQAALRLAE